MHLSALSHDKSNQRQLPSSSRNLYPFSPSRVNSAAKLLRSTPYGTVSRWVHDSFILWDLASASRSHGLKLRLGDIQEASTCLCHRHVFSRGSWTLLGWFGFPSGAHDLGLLVLVGPGEEHIQKDHAVALEATLRSGRGALGRSALASQTPPYTQPEFFSQK